MTIQALTGIKVLDFSTLLPGPLASLILAEAGAQVTKVERPGGGDDMRRFAPQFGADSGCFSLLNRGKESITIDMKQPDQRDAIYALVRESDILIEQFRPGVMDRLGLGYERARQLNPRLVYCSITGYGQTGPKSMEAGHDLNYLAETGLLSQSMDATGRPGLPQGLIADIGGGALPAVFNILLALRQAEASGIGCYLDIAMSDNVFAWQYTALALSAVGDVYRAGGELNTGGSPRYQIYRTADHQFIAAAPMEDIFWSNFCEAIGLARELRDDSVDPEATIAAVEAIMFCKPAREWLALFNGKDVCCSLVIDTRAALDDPHFRARGLFDSQVRSGSEVMTALPVPLAPALRQEPSIKDSPAYR